MICWKCGKEINEGSLFCSYCGADQKAAPALKKPGTVLRQVYLNMGETALRDAEILPNALLEALPEEKMTAMRLKMALNEGIGQYYLEQIPKGKPGSEFVKKVKTALTEQVGLGEKPALNLMTCLSEMLGWSVPAEQMAE